MSDLQNEPPFEDDLVHWNRCDDATGFYEFTVGELKTPIALQVGWQPDRKHAFLTLSHVIKTPAQFGPYFPQTHSYNELQYAIAQGVTAITVYYRDAVRKGHQPSEEWLLKKEL